MDKEKFDKLMDFLAGDEEEAIKGYDDVIAQLQDEPQVIEQLKKIREEEENHLNFLRKVKEDHKLVYVDEHDEEDHNMSEEDIRKLFGLD